MGPPAKGKGKKEAPIKGGKSDGKDGKGKGKDSGKATSKGKYEDGGKGAKGKNADFGGKGKGKNSESGKGKGKAEGKGKNQDGDDSPAKERAPHEYSLEGRPYSAALNELFKSSAVRPNDFDPKAVQLLDALHTAGKDKAAVAHLAKSVESVTRDKVTKMRAYIYALLRAFDMDVYTQMKETRGWPSTRKKAIEKGPVGNGMNASAPNFVPGARSFGAEAMAPEFVPGQLWPGLPGLPFAQVPTPFVLPMMPAQMKFAHMMPAQAVLPVAGAAVPVAGSAVEPPAKKSEGISFSVEYKENGMGETVAVVGSIPELGSWDVAGAKKLTTGPESFPVWKSDTIQVAATDFEYKFVILKGDKPEVRWEFESRRVYTKNVDTAGKVAKFGELEQR